MLVSLTRPVTPESSLVPGRLPKPTRHPISLFFPLPYTQVPLYSNLSLAFSGVPSKGDKIFGRLWRHPMYGR